ncbi:LysR family transcriptional regulator [Nocardia cyriacigeorgica]|uniref:LysR family transcriptional regulator n=1 Tax=Nocardia cyriacigeorgica TaxID=135487 RepID=A0A6P1CRV6_9NOCA|nr:LysR family transcriptional regulator [Nocardia cyriacigeorgica]MBF6080803.1 LysR family transcriptional regulator [Nocardia cyriacigeorgica]MBF6284685.1 LysR family transcriptional regulator [Nocardia cyriacigeorgica]NEW33996.1 LysR family transcriptional regulator [Nocardia cyriacigeorgica]BDU07452.1 LysR family transcriptional regulator [Nocardia cyriacigeorgica]
MESLDMNLLVALDALLETNSVTLAAERLHTSAPAMSRTLARLRRVLGDPLLVRAGRNLVPTPRALELRHEVSRLVDQGRSLLTPRAALDPATLKRGFSIRAGDGVLAELSAPLLAAVRDEAPGVTLHFLPDTADGAGALREGRVDVEVGVIEHTDPETVVQHILLDRWIGVAAPEHPLITDKVTVAAYAGAAHLSISRVGRARGPIDDRLALHGRTRRVVATVPDLMTGLLAVRAGALVCPAPARLSAALLAPLGLCAFDIPLPLPGISVGMAWHPRNTADSGHLWLRGLIRTILTAGAAAAADPVAADITPRRQSRRGRVASG